MPARVDVVVIGGGIVGVCAALFLVRKGLSVALCEKGRIGAEQSGRNWGWCRQMGRDPLELPLAMQSLALWRDPAALAGADTGFRTTGILYLCSTEGEVGRHAAWLDSVRGSGVDSRLLSSREVAALLPDSARKWAGALYTPSDGGAEPHKAAPAIATAARQLGAVILTQCAVRGVETSAGRVHAAITERGAIRCDAVVLAAGAWSRLFCSNLGIDLPQMQVMGSVARTQPLPGGPDVSLAGPKFGFRKRDDGGYTVSQAGALLTDITPDSLRLAHTFAPALRREWRNLRLRLGRRFFEEWRTPRRWRLDAPSPFEAIRVLDPVPSPGILDEARSQLIAAFPFFRGMVVQESWGGIIDVTPDALPVIAMLKRPANFLIATGFSGHGFGVGPAAGRLVADLIGGDAPSADPAVFRLERFSKNQLSLMRQRGLPPAAGASSFAASDKLLEQDTR
jgi:glycine/D-amino acid oxidase-like deaminating enzyme